MENLLGIIQAAGSGDQQTMAQANEALDSLSNNETTYPYLLNNLLDIFCNDTLPVDTRKMAGIQFKNQISSTHSIQTTATLQRKYLFLSKEQRSILCQKAQNALISSSPDISSVAAQVVTEIAHIEVPNKVWESFCPDISSIIQNGNETQKIAGLIVIGYFCEDATADEDDDNQKEAAPLPSAQASEKAEITLLRQQLEESRVKKMLVVKRDSTLFLSAILGCLDPFTPVVSNEFNYFNSSVPFTQLPTAPLNPKIVVEALKALYHAAPLLSKHLSQHSDRNLLFSIVLSYCCAFGATLPIEDPIYTHISQFLASQDPVIQGTIQQKALSCLKMLCRLYYNPIAEFIPLVYSITSQIITNTIRFQRECLLSNRDTVGDEVYELRDTSAKFSLEFWDTLCQHEIDTLYEHFSDEDDTAIEDSGTHLPPPEGSGAVTSLYYSDICAMDLFKVLLEVMSLRALEYGMKHVKHLQDGGSVRDFDEFFDYEGDDKYMMSFTLAKHLSKKLKMTSSRRKRQADTELMLNFVAANEKAQTEVMEFPAPPIVGTLAPASLMLEPIRETAINTGMEMLNNGQYGMDQCVSIDAFLSLFAAVSSGEMSERKTAYKDREIRMKSFNVTDSTLLERQRFHLDFQETKREQAEITISKDPVLSIINFIKACIDRQSLVLMPRVLAHTISHTFARVVGFGYPYLAGTNEGHALILQVVHGLLFDPSPRIMYQGASAIYRMNGILQEIDTELPLPDHLHIFPLQNTYVDIVEPLLTDLFTCAERDDDTELDISDQCLRSASNLVQNNPNCSAVVAQLFRSLLTDWVRPLPREQLGITQQFANAKIEQALSGLSILLCHFYNRQNTRVPSLMLQEPPIISYISSRNSTRNSQGVFINICYSVMSVREELMIIAEFLGTLVTLSNAISSVRTLGMDPETPTSEAEERIQQWSKAVANDGNFESLRETVFASLSHCINTLAIEYKRTWRKWKQEMEQGASLTAAPALGEELTAGLRMLPAIVTSFFNPLVFPALAQPSNIDVFTSAAETVKQLAPILHILCDQTENETFDLISFLGQIQSLIVSSTYSSFALSPPASRTEAFAVAQSYLEIIYAYTQTRFKVNTSLKIDTTTRGELLAYQFAFSLAVQLVMFCLPKNISPKSARSHPDEPVLDYDSELLDKLRLKVTEFLVQTVPFFAQQHSLRIVDLFSNGCHLAPDFPRFIQGSPLAGTEHMAQVSGSDMSVLEGYVIVVGSFLKEVVGDSDNEEDTDKQLAVLLASMLDVSYPQLEHPDCEPYEPTMFGFLLQKMQESSEELTKDFIDFVKSAKADDMIEEEEIALIRRVKKLFQED